jgi:RNA polymerase sigma-70 factor (ECF subfamily)
MSERTDEDLMLAATQGDVPAFEELVGRYRDSLVLYFERRIRDPQQAQDMAQDVLLKLWAARERYAPLGRTAQYLFTIARNHLFNRLDAMSRRPRGESLDSGDPRVFRELPRTASSEEAALRAWARAQVQKAIEGLPVDQRQVVVLSRVEGLKYHEIAERLGVPVGTVKSRMHYAVCRLRERLNGIIT